MDFSMSAHFVLIKKYENRRLYDATNSRYVNLEEVAQLVQQGLEIQVVDAASGEDITRIILTQIIAEGAKAPNSNFPLDILRQMVIASGRASHESAIRYTKAMLDLYQSTYHAMVPALNPFDYLRTQAGQPAGEAGRPVPIGGDAPKVDASAEPDDVAQLRERLSQLERAISGLTPKKASKKQVIPNKKLRRK